MYIRSLFHIRDFPRWQSVKCFWLHKAHVCFRSGSMHMRVPRKVKENIWSGEFVELSTKVDEEVDDITINIKSGQISTKPAVRKIFMTIEQWTDAFSLYASVYRLKFPDEAEQLSSYMNRIRRIANERGAWYFYDKNFRQIRKDANLSWDDIETDLYYTALNRKTPPSQSPFRNGRGPGQSRAPSSNTCNKFNKGEPCSGCRYQHLCQHCRGTHPMHKCWKVHSSRYNNHTDKQQQSQAKEGSYQPTPLKKSNTSDTGKVGSSR